MRIFIAVDISEPRLVSVIARMRDTIVGTGVPMKPVEEQNFHITLRFIGEVPDSVVEEVKDILAGIEFSPFRVTLKGLGAFPTPSRPRVVWIGVSEGFDELRKIRDEIERGLRRIGIRPDRQEFHPHLTLARIKGSRGIARLSRIIGEYADYEFGTFTVDRIKLKKSTLTRHGPIYEDLMEVKAR